MSLTVSEVERVFVYNGVKLVDPGPGLTPEQVRDVYAQQYPEITTATIEGPTKVGEVMQYEFKRKLGTKG